MGTGTAVFDLAGPTLTASSTGHSRGTGTARFALGATVNPDSTLRSAVVLTATPSAPSLSLFSDLHTKIVTLHPHAFVWRHEVSAPGSISFELAADSGAAAMVAGGCFVKAYWKGKSWMGARIKKSATNRVVDGTCFRRWDAQPGLLEMLNDGLVLPEYGIGSLAGDTRTFGYMSKRDSWWDPDAWTNAIALAFADDTRVRKGKPAQFRGLGAKWIAKDGPYVTQPANKQNWFVKDFTTYTAIDYEYVDAADDHRDAWLDGEQIGAKQDSNMQSYRYMGRHTGHLLPGKHKIAVQIGNSSLTTSHNPVAYIAALRILGTDGNPVKGAPYLVSDESWLAADDVSGWHRGAALLRMWEENANWPVLAFHQLHPGFTDTRDADGFGYADYSRITQPIGRSLLEVMQEFAETSLDFDADASTGTIHAFKRLGSDRRATVHLRLRADGGGLLAHEPTRIEPTMNSALMHLQDGTWAVREDDDSIADVGRIAASLSISGTAWPSTANAVADAQFNETAHVTRTFESVEIGPHGPQAYEHFFLGDTVTAIDEDGDDIPVRVMTIQVEKRPDRKRPRVYVDLIEDRSAA